MNVHTKPNTGIIGDNNFFLTVWQNEKFHAVGSDHAISATLLAAVENGIEAGHGCETLGGEGKFEIIEFNPVERTSRYVNIDAAQEWFNTIGYEDLETSDDAPQFIQDHHPDLDNAIAESIADADEWETQKRSFAHG